MTISEIAEIARQRLGWPVSDGPRLEVMVPQAHGLLIEKLGKTHKRRYTFSDPAETFVTLESDGTADLRSLSDDDGVLLNMLEYGEVRHPSSRFPLTPISGSGQGELPSNQASLNLLDYWMVGTVIHTRSSDNNETPLTGTLRFATPHVGALADLPNDLKEDLVDEVILLARGQIAQPKAE